MDETRERLSPERETESVQDQKDNVGDDLFNQNNFGAEKFIEDEDIKSDIPVKEENLVRVDNNLLIDHVDEKIEEKILEDDKKFTVQEEVIEAHERVEKVYEPSQDNTENLFEKQSTNEAEAIQLNSIVPSESLTSDLSDGIVLRNKEIVEENEERIDDYEGGDGGDGDDDDEGEKDDIQTPSVSLVQDLTAVSVHVVQIIHLAT